MSDFANSAKAAEHLDLTVNTVRTHAKNGTIPAVKVGSRWRFDLDAIDAHLSAPKDSWAQSNQSRGRRRK